MLPNPLASLSSPAFPVASCVPQDFVLNGSTGRLSILWQVVGGEIPVVPMFPTRTHTWSPNAEPLFWLMPLSNLVSQPKLCCLPGLGQSRALEERVACTRTDLLPSGKLSPRWFAGYCMPPVISICNFTPVLSRSSDFHTESLKLP